MLAVLIALATLQLAAGLGAPGPELAGASRDPSAVAGLLPGQTVGPAGVGPAPGSSDGPGVSAVGTSGVPPASPRLSPSPTRAPGVSPLVLAALEARLAELRDAYGIPGISATVVFKDGSRWTGASGLADVATGRPVRPGTPFAIASMSKTFTSALILRLVEAGQLRLEEPAAPHLAAFPGIVIDKRITIAQLLDHTSGLADFLLNPKIEAAFAAKPDAIWTPAQAFAYQPKPLGAPGSVWYYSNANYLILGLIAEQVTGQSMAANLREAFFGPLGLLSASYQGVEPSILPVARAYRFNTASPTETPIEMTSGTGVVPFQAVVTAAGGAGSVAAASPDVATWARALYTGQVLSMATVTRMVDDAARTTAIDPELPYGLGVHVVDVDGHPTFGHTGRYLGARGAVRYFPLEGITIAILTNQSRTDPSEILVELLRLALQG